jgi:hypothetical protein
MAYTIYKSNGTSVTVADNTIDNMFYNPAGGATNQGMGLQLVGRNTLGYGAAIAQNILQSAENFANPNAPADSVALQGQLWFNTTTKSMYVRVGASGQTGGLVNWNQLPIFDQSGNLTVPGTITATGGVAGNSATSTNLVGGVAGSVPYQSAPSTTAMLSPGIDGQVMTLVNGLPTWTARNVAGVSSIIAGSNISVSSPTGDVTVSVTGTVPSAAVANSLNSANSYSVNNLSSTGYLEFANADVMPQIRMKTASAGKISFYDNTDPDYGIYNYTLEMDVGEFGFYFSGVNTPYDLGTAKFTCDYNGNGAFSGSVQAVQFNGSGNGLTGLAPGLSIGGTANNATNATNIYVTNNDVNSNYSLLIVPSSGAGYQTAAVDGGGSLLWDTATNVMTVGGTITATTFNGSLNGNSSTASVASTLQTGGGASTFHWSGQGGQPTWLWGGNAESDMYVYNPGNFSVNYATTAGNGGVTSVNGLTGAVNIGIGGNSQTWQNVTGSRAWNVIYTNTTSNPIQVIVSGEADENNVWYFNIINPSSATVGSPYGAYTSNTAVRTGGSVCAIIPSGWKYKMSGEQSTAVWLELR